jgi:phosphoribosylanthranilate isomerase
VFVKICGITTEDDALLAVALGANAVGFVFAPSPRQMAPRKVYDITRRLPPETLTFGVFRDEAPQRVIEIVNEAGVKGAQLHGREAPADTLLVHGEVRVVIKAFAAGAEDLRRAADHGADALLIDSPNPGSGLVFDWGLVDEAPQDAKIILAGGLTPGNVATAITRVRPWGVDVASGVERTPGRKDPVKLKAFIDAARTALPAAEAAPDTVPYDWADE